ncbi:MAG: outer membrane protein assembly factor BamB [Ectothiorhodospiraceae bacterium]|jgi:outer membrane protein assembly factor BamB
MRLLALLSVLLVLSGCGTPDVLEATDAPDVTVNGDVQPQRLWSEGVGGATGLFQRLEPALADGHLYVASAAGRVQSLAADTGRRQWSKSLDRPLSGGPAVGAGLLAIGTRDGAVLGLSAKDGELLWESGVTSEVLAPPAVGPDAVIVRTNDGRVFDLDPASGERRWIYDRNVPTLSLRGHGSPVFVRGGVLVGFDNGRLAALRLDDGTPAWEATVGVPKGRTDLERMVDVDADPVVAGGDVFAASYQGRVAGVTLRNGRISWSRDMSVYSGLAVDDGNVYVCDADGNIWALDRYNGASVWRQDALAGTRLSPPAFHGDYLVVGGGDGYLYWLSRDDGHLVARREADDTPVAVRPLAGPDGRLYTLSVGGELTAWAALKGKN